MNQDVKSQLLSIARQSKMKTLAHRNWVDGSVFIWNFGEELIRLACDVKGSTVFYEYALPVFFTDKAVEYLLKLPNLYWFWSIVEAGASVSTRDKIDQDDINVAVAVRFRQEFVNKGVRLDRSIHVVSPTEACFLLEKGVVLLEHDEDHIVLTRNPVFELR